MQVFRCYPAWPQPDLCLQPLPATEGTLRGHNHAHGTWCHRWLYLLLGRACGKWEKRGWVWQCRGYPCGIGRGLWGITAQLCAGQNISLVWGRSTGCDFEVMHKGEAISLQVSKKTVFGAEKLRLLRGGSCRLLRKPEQNAFCFLCLSIYLCSW